MAFTDTFLEGADTNLEDHTPSGGTAWTRVDGSAGAMVVEAATDSLRPAATTGAYLCDDQGSARQYAQFTCRNTGNNSFVTNRATDSGNYVGVRCFGTNLQIYKDVATTLTQLGGTGSDTLAVGNVIRFESNGNTHTAYINGVPARGVGGVDSAHSSITRQGVAARQALTDGQEWIDDFEAGTLGTANSVAFDAATPYDGNNDAVQSFTHTPAGTPTGVGIGIAWRDDTADVTISSVTYGGQTCAVEDTQLSETNKSRVALYSLASPPTGAQLVEITFSGALDSGCSACSVTVTGGDTSNVFRAVAKGTGTSTIASINVTSDPDDLVMDIVIAPSTASSIPASTQTERMDIALGSAWSNSATRVGGTSLANMMWTFPGNVNWGIIAGSFMPGTGGPTQSLAPIQDISAGTWIPSAGSPAELWEMLDGDSSPDTDYAYTLEPSTMEVKFAPGNTPTLQTGHTISYRLVGNGTTDAVVKLKCGTTVISQWTETNVPAVETVYSHTLDSSPSFTIADYTDLRLSVEAV